MARLRTVPPLALPITVQSTWMLPLSGTVMTSTRESASLSLLRTSTSVSSLPRKQRSVNWLP
jgi:hypothetical protein